MIGIAAATALLVGALAGFGGASLTRWSSTGAGPAPASPTLPSTSAQAPSTTTPVAPPPGQANTVDIAAKVLPSTVTISVTAASGQSSGSGFVLDQAGRIMTNNHVVEDAADGRGTIRVTFADGKRAEATIVGRSKSYDLAVIKVQPTSTLVPMEIGDSDATKVGESAIAVGSPLGLGGTVTEGIVSAKGRPVVVNGSSDADDATAYIDAIQTDAPINPGNSGGPLVDAGGRVIGVNSAILTLGTGSTSKSGSIGLGFAIPVNQAMQIGTLLIKDGKASYPVIGTEVKTEKDDDGVRLVEVTAGGPADQAGFKPGDIVTAIDGTVVHQMVELIVAVRTHRPGDTVTIDFRRHGSDSQARVTLGGKEG